MSILHVPGEASIPPPVCLNVRDHRLSLGSAHVDHTLWRGRSRLGHPRAGFSYKEIREIQNLLMLYTCSYYHGKEIS